MGTGWYRRSNSGYIDNLSQNIYGRQYQQRGQGIIKFLNFQHTAAVIVHVPNDFSF